MTFEHISEGDGALLCLSTEMECCSADEVSSRGVKGYWHNPSGFDIPNAPHYTLYRDRGHSVVRLNRNVASTEVQNGIFKCTMSNGTEDVTFFIGIYPEGLGELHLALWLRKTV